MKPDTQLLKDVWRKSCDMISDHRVATNDCELDTLGASVFSNGPFYFYILDFSDFSLDYVSPSMATILGLDPEAVSFDEIPERIHPDDMAFVSRAERRAFELIDRHVTPAKRRRYKISYCFRMRTADGTYQLFNHQAIMLSEDEDHRVSKSLNIHTNISHLGSKGNDCLSIIGLMGEPSFMNISLDNEPEAPEAARPRFTDREMEVIYCLSEGLTSREIAARLFISPETVKNHRKNIMKKSGCKNVGQLVRECIARGLI